MTVNVNSVTHL